MIRRPPRPPLFPSPPLSRPPLESSDPPRHVQRDVLASPNWLRAARPERPQPVRAREYVALRSEEHTSELQSHLNLVCRLLLEKKKTPRADRPHPTRLTWRQL